MKVKASIAFFALAAAGTLSVSAQTTTVGYLTILPQNVAAAEGGEIQLKGTSSWPDWFLDNQGERFRIHSSGVTRMEITSSGNVGIGVSLPQAKLEVAGNIISRT